LKLHNFECIQETVLKYYIVFLMQPFIKAYCGGYQAFVGQLQKGTLKRVKQYTACQGVRS